MPFKLNIRQIVLALLLLAVAGTACDRLEMPATPTEAPGVRVFVPVVSNLTPTPFQPPQGSTDPAYPPPPTAASGTQDPGQSSGENSADRISLSVATRVPGSVAGSLALPDFLSIVPEDQNPSVRLDFGDAAVISRALYALVAPFPTVEDGVAAEEVRRAWRGNAEGPFAGQPIMVDAGTLAAFTSLWGDPAAGAVEVLGSDEILNKAWERQRAWALIPFEALEPRWKVLEVGGSSPIRKDFDPAAYPLTAPLSLYGDEALVGSLLSLYGPESETPLLPPVANYDPAELTTVMLTGVTALVRATAWTMERQGITYPAEDIRPWLRQADILHISNEIPFASNCPYPNPVQPDLRFCSDPRYIELLEDIGTDVVELTGDHFQDWGPEAMFLTLDMYQERGWPYYGGGENLEDARKAVTFEHNGNRIAFIGCNRKGGGYAGASATTPGAVSCDYDWIYSEIARLKSEGYVVIATFQHFEYYTYLPEPDQIADAEGMAQAGADIVSGSQAHHPQALAFYGDTLAHHGLGNLFFDQFTVTPNGDIAFIDRHVVYDGRYISTELLTIQFIDFARPRPMTPEERVSLLSNTFRASGW